MSKTNPNDLAAPRHWTETYPSGITHLFSGGGLTKREHIAIAAMQGLLSNNVWMENYRGNSIYEIAAEDAVKATDILINALNQESK